VIVGRPLRCAAAAASAAFALVVAAPAAANTRTFVASFGLDSQPCTLALPCRGFTVALAATDPGGEIVVLDSAGYGAVTIGKSVSITVPAGVYAGVSVLGGDGITINGAGINVALTGLTINGQGGTHGIRFIQGARLSVDNCQVVGMGGNGLRVEGAGTIVVTRSAIRSSAQQGVFVNAAANVSIIRSRIQASGNDGIAMSGGASGSVVRTLVADSGAWGVVASQTSAGTTRIALDDATITDNDLDGVLADATGASANARVDVTNSLVARNFNGLYAFAQPGGSTTMSSTGNAVVENTQAGVTTFASGGTAALRAARTAVFRNPVAGLLQSSGTLSTPGGVTCAPQAYTNYVRDNDGGDNFGAGSVPDCLR